MDTQRPLLQLGLYYYLEYHHPRVHFAIFDATARFCHARWPSGSAAPRLRRMRSRLRTGRWVEHMRPNGSGSQPPTVRPVLRRDLTRRSHRTHSPSLSAWRGHGIWKGHYWRQPCSRCFRIQRVHRRGHRLQVAQLRFCHTFASRAGAPNHGLVHLERW